MQQMYSCPNCNYPVAFGTKFCTNCGTPLMWQPQPPPPTLLPKEQQQQEQGQRQQTATKTRKHPLAIAFTLLIVVALLVTAGIFAFGELSPIPVISDVYASSITDSSVVITWLTDRQSTSQVEYGTAKLYGSTSVIDQSQVTTHSITLYGLMPNTAYHCRVKSKGSNWNEAVSSDITFTSAASTIP